MLELLDLGLDLAQHREQFAPLIGQLIDNEVIIVDILAVLLAHLFLIRTLDLVGGSLGPPPLGALKRLLEVLLLLELWLGLDEGAIREVFFVLEFWAKLWIVLHSRQLFN